MQASARVATSFGQLLRQHRLDAGLTQGVLAERAGVSVRALQYLEGRFGQPFPETVRRLSQALDLSPEHVEQFVAAALPAPRRRQTASPSRENAAPAANPALAAILPPAPPASGLLPTQLTSFVGREHDLAAARALLLRPTIRLLTLTGPPGTGKTRLAIELAATLTERFANGVVFVSLAPLTDPALVLDTIAQTLGVLDVRAASSLAAVTGHLRDRETLLLLDNFEQVLPAARQVADLLGACTRLTILVTSQAPLAIRGEHELAISPLPVPDPTQIASASMLADSAAVALFVDRAQAVRADFALTDANAATVAEICARLDGLPLAIELAAARIRLFSPQAMLARLERRLPLLTGGASDLPARQRTLRDTIAWSYDLLDPAEQALFRRLAVFVGGATLDAIEAVCGAATRAEDQGASEPERSSPFPPQSSILDTVATLVARSLLRQEEGPDGEPRFGTLETIHEYAWEQLQASGEAAVLRDRHLAYFHGLATAAAAEMRGARQAHWLDRLERENDNLRAALAWSGAARPDGVPGGAGVAVPEARVETGIRLASALEYYWLLRGQGRENLAQMMVLVGLAVPETAARAEALTVAALVRGEILRDHVGAVPMLDEADRIWRSLGDRYGVAVILERRGRLTFLRAEYGAAATAFAEARDRFRELGQESGLPIPISLELGWATHAQGDLQRAAEHYDEALTESRTSGDGHSEALVYQGLARLRRTQGAPDQAVSLLHRSLALFGPLADMRCAPSCLSDLAGLLAEQGKTEAVARLFGVAEALREQRGRPLNPAERESHDRGVEALKRRLDAQALAAAWAEGRRLTLEQAIALALDLRLPPSDEQPRA